MRIKDCLKTLLVFLLVLSTLLTAACGKKDQAESNQSENKSEETAGSPDGCTHADYVLQNAKAATCLEEGYSGDRICKACGALLEKGKTLGVTDHMWDDGMVTKNATCVTTGTKTVTCKTCFITETQTIELTPCKNEYHFEANEAHRLVCGVCYRSTSGEHTKSELVANVGASCLEDAYSVYHCTDCDSDFKVYDTSKPAVGHNWDVENPVVIPATCSAEGSQHFVCKNEGCDAKTEEYILQIAPGLHTYVLEYSYESTCTSNGYERYTCSGCGLEKEITLAKLPHSYGEATVEGDWTYKTCFCGHRLSSYNASGKDSASLSTDGINYGEAFAINLQNATIEFPSSVAESMKGSNSVSIDAGFVGSDIKDGLLSSSAMADEDKAALSASSSKIYDFGVKTDDSSMHSFNERVTVTVPYTLGENEDPEGIVIWYVAANGELEAIEDVAFYDEDGDGVGNVAFTVEHFSYYAIAYKETPEMRCRRGVHDYSNEDLWTAVEASCYFNGFTSKVCRICGNTAFDNFTAKKEHELGEKITPIPDCEKGGYVHQNCKNCSWVKNHEYIPATGHSMKNFATCDSAGTCEKCYRILVPAYGHDWSDWTVISNATETNAGLKRRNCPICGIIEDVKIPAKGNVTPWSFNSYSDVLDMIVSEALNLGNGKVTFKMNDGRSDYSYAVTVNQEGDTYIAYIKATVTYREEVTEYDIYYKNGVAVLDGDEGIRALDIDEYAQFMPDFEKMYEYMGNVLEYYDTYISPALEMTGKIMDEYIEVYGKGVNDKLSANGSKYTVEQIKDAFNSAHALYAYFCYKIGVDPVSGMPAGVDVPTKKDLHKLLGEFMNKSTSGGNTTYTYDLAEYKAMMDDMIKLAEDECVKTLSVALYSVLGDAITAHYPALTDWSKLVSHLKNEYSGSVKVKKVIDKLISLAEDSEACTADELYDMLSAAINAVTGESIDIKGFVNEYSNKTLDELIKQISDDEMTMSEFYSELDKYMTQTKLGDVIVDSYYSGSYVDGVYTEQRVEVTFSEQLAEMKENIASVKIEGKVNVTLNDQGSLMALDITEKVSENGSDENLSYFEASVAQGSDKITVPEKVKKYIDIKIEAKYDGNGNLIISGLPAGSKLSASLSGYADMTLADKLEKDDSLSAEYGIDVYVLKEQYWCESIYVGEYLLGPDGKLYEFSQEGYRNIAITKMVKYTEFLADPSAFLPSADAKAVAQFTSNSGEKVNVYRCVAGLCYQQDSEWMIITNKNYNGYENGLEQYANVSGVSYNEVFTSPIISNIGDGDYYEHYVDGNGKEYDLHKLYIQNEYSSNVGIPVTMINDEIYVVELDDSREDNYCENYYVGNEAVNAPEYDRISEYSNEDATFYKGEQKVDGYKLASLYANVPSYYAEYDGYYFRMSSYSHESSIPTYTVPFTKANVEGLEKHTLPDGRPVYVVNRSGDIAREGVIYGFIPVNSSLYAQVACEYKSNQLVSLTYRANATTSEGIASEYRNANIEDVIDIEKYVTYNANGSVTVSAEALKIINANCNGYGNMVSILVVADVDNGSAMVGVSHTLALVLSDEFDPSMITGESIRWNQWFDTEGEGSSNYNFTVNKNKDGSLEIVLSDGKAISFSFEFDMSQVASSDVLTPSASQSASYGFDVYASTEYLRENERYVLYNGKYYHQDYVYVAREYSKSTPVDMLRTHWRLYDIDYQFDEVDENSEVTGRIYRSRIGFFVEAHAESSTEIYIKIADGKLYVLTGVSNASDLGLMYESMVPLTRFINGLSLVENQSMASDYYYLEDGKMLGRTYFDIKYEEEYISEIPYFYYQDGNKKQYIYVDGGFEHVSVPDTAKEVTLPAGSVETYRYDESWNGMKYLVLDIMSTNVRTSYYAKIGDKYVDFDRMPWYSAENAFGNIAERTYLIGVNTPNGWKYYEDYSWGNNGFVPSGQVSVASDAKIFRDYYIGSDANGYAMYQFDVYDMSSVDVHVLDGVEVYCQKGTTNDCYAKLSDNCYIRGYLTETGSGYSFTPEYWYETEFDSNELAGALQLHRLIKVNGDTATVPASVLEKLEKYSEHVRIRITRYSDYGYDTVATVNYSELQSWFED